MLKQKIIKITASAVSALFIGISAVTHYYSKILPENITSETLSNVKIADYPEIVCGKPVTNGEIIPVSNQATLSLFGAIPVKNVEIREAEAPVVCAGGFPFGIKLLMDGVMVTELGKVENTDGNFICPAEIAGIKTGDIICLADNTPIASNTELQEVINDSSGRTVKLTVMRDGEEKIIMLDPVYSENSNTWKGGMWVRDSIAGIGTVTFIDKSTGEFAGLGHPICDSDTREIVPINTGEAVPVEITEVTKGIAGIPGALHGNFSGSESYGILTKNRNTGIYGKLTDSALREIALNSEEYKIGYRQEIKTGEAFIITSVKGNKPEKYSINIENIDYSSTDDTKNMMIRITDERLLNITGGIVQGMSGSPIIQNEKLIGAVTHVFVSSPEKGYGIFAENMAEYICF